MNSIVARDMTHTLTIALGDAADLRWAQATVTAAHYLHAPVDPRARPMVYVIRDASQPAPAQYHAAEARARAAHPEAWVGRGEIAPDEAAKWAGLLERGQ